MTILEVISQADTLVPNTIPEKTKIRWVQTDEAFARTLYGREEAEEYTMDTRLSISWPWDEMYIHSLCARIHHYHGDDARYNQASAQANACLMNLLRYRLRTGLTEGETMTYF